MRTVRCSQGHYYDADKYPSCPHCNGSVDDNVTVYLSGQEQRMPVEDPDKTVAGNELDKITNDLDEGKTISLTANDQLEGTSRPTVGWLVCVGGPFAGKDYCLQSGSNFIGRDSDMDVCLAGDNTVSRRRHAIVIYEPRQNIFMVRPGDSRELFYLKDEVVLEPKKIVKNYIIQVGDVSLMLIPCCDDKFTWPMPE